MDHPNLCFSLELLAELHLNKVVLGVTRGVTGQSYFLHLLENSGLE